MTAAAKLEGKRILVTGARGFIGHKLCISLQEMGAEIYAVSTREQAPSEVIHEWLVGDLADYDFTESLVKRSRPDIVFHLAGYATGLRTVDIVRPTFRNNLLATLNMLIAFAESDIKRLVLAGSLEEPVAGDVDAIPVSPYAASKWASTQYARMFYRLYKMPVAMARIFMVYGPGDRNFKNLIPYVIRSLLNNEVPKLTSGKRLVDWVYIDDVVDGLIKMGVQEGIEGRSIDLGTGEKTSVKEICSKIKDMIGVEMQLDFGLIPDRPFERETEARLEETRNALDWSPKINVDTGLQKTIDWVRESALKA